jgi:hypothetical protein
MRRAGTPFSQWLQVFVFDHQGVAMLLQEEPNLGRGRSILQQQGILDYAIEIEKLDQFQRTPYLFPPAAQVWAVQHVHKRTLQARDSDTDSGAFKRLDLK